MLRKIKALSRYCFRKSFLHFFVFFLRFYGRKRKIAKHDVRFLGYKIHIVDGPSFLWQMKDVFVDEAYMFNSDSTQPVIYDCGSNIGIVSLYFKKLFPGAKIVAFEADAKLATLSKDNFIRNQIDDIEVIHAAVWIDNNGIDFYPDGADGGSVYGHGTPKKVSSIRLRNMIANEGLIDFLKIDIEGAEVSVLADCSDVLENVKNIFIEYHSFAEKPQELSQIMTILEASGFRYYLSTITKRPNPFVRRTKDSNMDMQLNIFGYRQ
tara:strand:- start:12684 stop:13478 length:795 start_codon:yes stop_codon:yes gene_type:complete